MVFAANPRVVTSIGGRGAVEEGRGVIFGAGAVGQQVGRFIESNDFHAAGRHEFVGVRVLRQLDGLLHERCPNRCGGACTLDATEVCWIERGVVVIATHTMQSRLLVKPANHAS